MYRLQEDIREFLDRKAEEYNRPAFIDDDPVSIPHLFTARPDIEIAGFFAAIFSWGNRTTIIRKSRELMRLMDDAPYQFVLQHKDPDLKKLLSFKHRTFTPTDLLYFIAFFKAHYTRYDTLEDAFLSGRKLEESIESTDGGDELANGKNDGGDDVGESGRGVARGFITETRLSAFYQYFFSLEDPTADRPGVRLAPPRTYKHISSPAKNSACKRLNMFLRWMVRRDGMGVDFGLWNRMQPSDLICPLDVHVARVAQRFGLLSRPNADWKAAVELTACLAAMDASDPVKYDYALFGLGVMEKY